MTEEQLIEGCKKQDNNARRCLYEQYARKMFALSYRYVNDYDVAQDVLQDGFLKVYERVHGFMYQGSLEGWMKRIFVNTALDHLRKQKYHVSVEEIALKDEIEQQDDLAEGSSDISSEILMSMLQKLPKGYATVFNLLAVEEYSSKEVAAMLDITEGGVRSQYARARKMLIKMVREYQIQNG
ncbi:MAG: putative polymerase ECF-type sigma factor [Bacteroidetes bacterium]|jgi:RNA polymerase sigma factor (sigma-70 family)|nr:putative polymerase ECF-type sigma factor [Bacteroidota bacterium]